MVKQHFIANKIAARNGIESLHQSRVVTVCKREVQNATLCLHLSIRSVIYSKCGMERIWQLGGMFKGGISQL